MNYNDYSPTADKHLKIDGSITDFAGNIIEPPDIERAEMYRQMSPRAAKWVLPDGSVTDKMPTSDENTTKIYSDDTEPEDWRDGDWWFEPVVSTEIKATPVEVTTIPFDGTKPFHMELGDITETLLNVTDNEQTATEEDLIII